ncbi:hypothetical protein Tco_1441447, partial [Tanacetum coccineum]
MRLSSRGWGLIFGVFLLCLKIELQVLLRHSVDGNDEGTGVLHVLTHCKETCCCPRFRNRLHLRLPASVDLCPYVGCRAANANDDSSGDLDVITGDVTLHLRHIA